MTYAVRGFKNGDMFASHSANNISELEGIVGKDIASKVAEKGEFEGELFFLSVIVIVPVFIGSLHLIVVGSFLETLFCLVRYKVHSYSFFHYVLKIYCWRQYLVAKSKSRYNCLDCSGCSHGVSHHRFC